MKTRDELRAEVLSAMDYNDGFSDDSAAVELLDGLLAAERARCADRIVAVMDADMRKDLGPLGAVMYYAEIIRRMGDGERE